MNRWITLAALVAALVLAVGTTWAAEGAAPAAKKINVVLITGGHGFEEKPFLAVFEAMPGIAFSHVALKAGGELFEDTSQFPYDVIVLYNMTQKISEKQQKNFIGLLEKGVGLVATHHCLGAWQDWPQYRKIIGGKYYLKAVEEDGAKRAASTYKHGVDIKVRVEDAQHPITQGVSDFTIHDEAYKGYSVDPKAHVILTSDDPVVEKAVGWTGTYGKARTCYLLLGHDSKAYASKEYQRLVSQAIQWAAAK